MPEPGGSVSTASRVHRLIAAAGIVLAGTLVGTGAPALAIAPEPTCLPPADSYVEMSGPEGRIVRLYGAYFGRSPDAEGFAFWLDKINSGEWTNSGASTYFANSPEFVERFGSDLSDGDFINRLYLNALCREPEPSGRSFWVGKLEEGMSRGQMVLLVSDSDEFREVTQTT